MGAETAEGVVATGSERDGVPISSMPRAGQNVTHNGKIFTTVREGLAYILVPHNARTTVDPKKTKNDYEGEVQSVFYNPIQQFNRDLSVLAIRAYGEDLMALKQKQSQHANRGRKRKRTTSDDSRRVVMKDDVSNAGLNGDVVESTNQEDGAAKAFGLQNQIPFAQVEKHEAGEQDVEMQGDGETGVKLTQEQTKEAQSEVQRPANGTGKLSPTPRRFKILDALSATGLRAIRYSHEIPFVTSVTANDLSKAAAESIKANITHNNLEKKIQVVTGNAMSHMYTFVSNPGDAHPKNKYDVIDLDPYGTAVPFLDGAVHAVNDGGLLCVTCTDAGIWASCGYPEKSYSQYGGTPMKGLHSHEGGLRLILHSIATAAARYGIAIEPLLSLSIDYYARVFVRVHHSPAEVKLLAGKTMLVYNCDGGCGAWTTQYLVRNLRQGSKNGQASYKYSLSQGPTAHTLCAHCGSKTHLSGPMWGGPLHNPKFIEAILNQLPSLDTKVYGTVERLEGMLTTALEETLVDKDADGEMEDRVADGRLVPRVDAFRVDRNPFFFIPSALAKVLHARAPSEAQVRGALKHAGYAVTRSHAKPGTIKTNAPWSFIWEMIREWVRRKAPIKEGAIKKDSAGWKIMYGDGIQASRSADSTAEDLANPAEVSTPTADPTDDNGGSSVATKEASVMTTSTKPGEIVFDEQLGKEMNKKRLRRYQENPRPNWGPMNRAKKVTAT